MLRKLDGRMLLALLGVAVLTVVMAAPAAADTGSATVDAGAITIDMTANGGDEFAWVVGEPPPDTPPCTESEDPVEISIDFDAVDEDDATTQVTNVSSPPRPFHADANNTWYVMELGLGGGNQDGTIVSGDLLQNLSLTATLSTLDTGETNCTPDDELCTATVFLDDFGGQLEGTWDGDATGPNGVATVSTGAAGDGAAFPGVGCQAPFLGWLGGGIGGVPPTITVADLVITVSPA